MISDYNKFVQLVDTSINAVCPQRKQNHTASNSISSRKSFVPPPWWTEKCDEAIKNRKLAFKNYKKLANYSNFLNFKKTKAIAKRTFSEAKREF